MKPLPEGHISRMKLTEIVTGASLVGIELDRVVSVVAAVPLRDGALQVIYRTPDGARILNNAAEASIGPAPCPVSDVTVIAAKGDGSDFAEMVFGDPADHRLLSLIPYEVSV